MKIFHGPRACVIAPKGMTFLAFDADGLHLREAAALSQDSFINEALTKYDETKDPRWKPHIQNCCALFDVEPDQAIEWMNQESPRYTFSKNWIYLILNGGDAPALANAAASAGLDFDVPTVRNLLDKWLERAIMFDGWRKGLVREVQQTGMITMFDGRRRRFYGLRWKGGVWVLDHDTEKEVYNGPLIMTEVSYVNPIIKKVDDWCDAHEPWALNLHSHDGFMLEGPKSECEWALGEILPLLPTPLSIGPGRWFNSPWGAKTGDCWAYLEKV